MNISHVNGNVSYYSNEHFSNSIADGTFLHKTIESCAQNKLEGTIKSYFGIKHSTSNKVFNKGTNAPQKVVTGKDQFSISSLSVAGKPLNEAKEKCAKEKCMERMTSMKPVIDDYLKAFENGAEYESLMHKFRTPRSQSCFLDAIATTLFGKEAKSEANQFTNNLRDYLENKKIINKGGPINTEESGLKDAVHKYIMMHYDISINVVILVAAEDFRFIQEDCYSDDMYKVPVMFTDNGSHQTFHGIVLDAESVTSN
ncbi:MAG: hypothetical protein QS721_09720 [Candidatus Endonucleobacter sp. (ex Gigantidas childressi)]|nr:hypothetical protein [Candidatus Endonucleobacter sp. (ex Gigantidas childressi)]